MTTRTVTGTILDADLTAAGVIIFSLNTDFVSTAGTEYLGGDISVTPDSLGAFSVALPVPDTGTAEYVIRLPGRDPVSVNLGVGAPTTLTVILSVPAASGTQNALQTLIDSEQTATIVNKTATYIILATDEVVRCSGTFTVTLPEATGSGRAYAVKNTGTGVITVACNGADTIDGSVTQTLYAKQHAGFLDAADGVWDLV